MSAVAEPAPAGAAGDPGAASGGRSGGPLLARVALLTGTLLAAVALGVLLIAATTGYAERPLPPAGKEPVEEGRAAPGLRELRQQEDRLAAELDRLQPRGAWIVIDRAHSRLELHRGDQVVLGAPCSAGSGIILKEPDGGRSWTFETPTGRFRVRTRLTDPLWRKPDWHFAEVGENLPKTDELRFEYGVLGEYALDIGDGYMIHGTLYERLLGKNVTHGCIRLGRDDLRVVYRECQVGTPVFIF